MFNKHFTILVCLIVCGVCQGETVQSVYNTWYGTDLSMSELSGQRVYYADRLITNPDSTCQVVGGWSAENISCSYYISSPTYYWPLAPMDNRTGWETGPVTPVPATEDNNIGIMIRAHYANINRYGEIAYNNPLYHFCRTYKGPNPDTYIMFWEDYHTNGDHIDLVIEFKNCDVHIDTDVNDDGTTDIDDIVQIIIAWQNGCNECPEDVSRNGAIDIDDIIIVLLNWGG